MGQEKLVIPARGYIEIPIQIKKWEVLSQCFPPHQPLQIDGRVWVDAQSKATLPIVLDSAVYCKEHNFSLSLHFKKFSFNDPLKDMFAHLTHQSTGRLDYMKDIFEYDLLKTLEEMEMWVLFGSLMNNVSIEICILVYPETERGVYMLHNTDDRAVNPNPS